MEIEPGDANPVFLDAMFWIHYLRNDVLPYGDESNRLYHRCALLTASILKSNKLIWMDMELVSEILNRLLKLKDLDKNYRLLRPIRRLFYLKST